MNVIQSMLVETRCCPKCNQEFEAFQEELKKISVAGILPSKILVFDIDKDQQVREHDVVFSKDKPNSTEFLIRLMFWALNNKMAIELVHRDDHVAENG